MRINSEGLALIKEFEGCKLTAYRCPAGIYTIGYGHTGRVKAGDKITEHEAEAMLRIDIFRFEEDVSELVKVQLANNQYSALVSFAFNVGSDIDTDILPEGLGDSTLLKLVNQSKYAEAAKQFLLWNKAGGKVLAGLTRRREAEKALFEKSEWK